MGRVNSIDPRTGAIAATVAEETGASEVQAIAASAQRAGQRLAQSAPAARAALLDAMATALEDRRAELVVLADRESALGAGRLDGEVSRTAGQLRLFAGVLREGSFLEAAIDHPAGASPDLRRMLIALGPVAVFGPSNFPFAFSAAGGDTASALAAGCPVVVKAHGAHPALDTAVVSILREAAAASGADSDIVQIVYGRAAGRALVEDPRIAAVGFTGSETAGRALMDAAAARQQPIPVYAEMGSLNPLIVSPGSAGEGLAQTISDSVLLGAGQFCTKPGLVFVPATPAGDSLVEGMRDRLEQHGAMYLLTAATRDGFLANSAAVAAAPAATALVRPEPGEGSATTPALAQVDAGRLSAGSALLAECFGPGTLAVRYRDTEDLLGALRSVPGSLAVSVFTQPGEDGFLAAVAQTAQAQTGRLVLNGVSTGVAVNWAQNHGGPYPASATPLYTSVGATAIRRFLRPVAFQDFPDRALPDPLKEDNPLRIPRRVDGRLQAATP